MLSREPNGAVPGCTGGEDDPTATNYCILEPEATRDVNNGAVVVSVTVVNGQDGAASVEQQQESSAFLSHADISLVAVASALLLEVMM
jgi:hypothetical protein